MLLSILCIAQFTANLSEDHEKQVMFNSCGAASGGKNGVGEGSSGHVCFDGLGKTISRITGKCIVTT